jgi:hypothetical protein
MLHIPMSHLSCIVRAYFLEEGNVEVHKCTLPVAECFGLLAEDMQRCLQDLEGGLWCECGCECVCV